MSAGWVAGSVRARALARRRLGPSGARRLAASASLADALRALAGTPYGAAEMPGQTLAGAQHAIAAAVLWDLRVLAGWLPRDGVRLLRTLAGWFELANVDELLQTMAGRPAGGEFRLGALATAWPQLRQAAGLRRAAGSTGRLAVAGPGWGHRTGGPAGYADTVGGAGGRVRRSGADLGGWRCGGAAGR